MAATTLSKGTVLKVRTGTSGAYTQVKGLKDFDGPGSGSASVMDVTDLDSVAKEKRMGLPDEGQIKYSFNFIPADPGQLILEAARSAQTLLSFQLTITDGGVVYTHDGYVLSMPKSGGVDKTMELSATVEITGAVTRSNAAV